MSNREQTIWGNFPTRRLAEKYQIDGNQPKWKAVQVALFLVLSLGCYFAASQYVWKSVQVVGSSMEPTLREGEFRILNRLVYFYRGPEVGEVVVFKDPLDMKLSVKRVIGGPGDVIDIEDGEVFVNSQKLPEHYLNDGTTTLPVTITGKDHLVVPEDCYYLMGDNRTRSLDSRVYGAVPGNYILGMVGN